MFDIADSAQFYRMVVADYDEFIAEQHSARRALHCAISAYHLHEWVWADWLKNDKTMQNHFKVHTRNEFLAWVMKHCIWFVCAPGVRNIAFTSKSVRLPICFSRLGLTSD
jgi:hypothetical protein